VPAAATDKPAFPAVRLDVLAPGVAAVEVRDAWVRLAVKGQSGTGAFMTLAAPSGAPPGRHLHAGRAAEPRSTR
jgi:copper(I)-binding protein